MEEKKPTRKRVPGISEHVRQIREINDRIAQINASIKECKESITDLIREERTNSPKVKLIEKKGELNEEFTVLVGEKSKLLEEKKLKLPEFLKIKEELFAEKKKINLKENVLEIEKKIEEINDKIMQSTLTTQQEKEYAKMLMDLKKKRVFCSTLKGKELKVKELSTELEVLKEKINAKFEALQKQKNNLTEVKNELNRLRDMKVKNPRIEENYCKITSLKKEKDDLLEKRKKVQELIQEKEREYERMMEELEKQMEIENHKKEIVKEMKEKEGQKNQLLKEITEIDPHKFDIIASELRNVSSNSLPLSLVKSLAQVKLPIPKNKEEIASLILKIKEEKRQYEHSIVGKVEDINKKIRDIDSEIGKCKEVLSKMPVVEVNLGRKMKSN